MAVNVKMGVDIGSFTSGIKQGQQILKGLNAEMKASEAEFKATGNAEQKLNSQTKTLNSQLNVQKGIAQQARQALKAMKDQGIDPADAAYQKMYVTLMNAEAGASEAQAALNALGSGAEQAAGGADKLSNSLGGISKKMSLDQVISGINTITTGLENAAKKAVQLGEQIWNAVMDRAQWADDTATMAQMYGIDLDTFMRMQQLVTNGMDTSVDAMLKSQKKLRKGIGDESDAVMDTLAQLGLAIQSGKEGTLHLITEDETDLFWRAGQALMAMSDAFDKESAAQALFGRSWEELVPLFEKYKSAEEYNKALLGVNVASEDSVTALAELNDKVSELKGNFDVLKTEVLGALAPALTDAASALNGLLTSVLDYLETDAGKQALADLSTAVSGLFDDLGKIDPKKVVEGFSGVFNKVVEGVQWVATHSGEVIAGMEAIVIGWGALKLTGGVLDIVKLINGISGLSGGAASAAATAGQTAGASWGSAFASAVTKAAPWLIGLYTLLKPGSTADNNLDMLFDPQTHELTQAGKDAGITMGYDEFMNWKATNRQRWSSEWNDATDNGRTWENQLKYGNAWVSMTQEQSDAVQKFYDIFREMGMDFTDADWDAYEGAFEGQADLFEKVDDLFNRFVQTHDGALPEDLPDDLFQVTADIVVPENAAEMISQQIGTVTIHGTVVTEEDGSHANGLWSVPYDGYLARLHKGERITPAREVGSRNYNSNLYVESMIMSGGTDAAGLASAMAAAQRRQMSGYGS